MPQPYNPSPKAPSRWVSWVVVLAGLALLTALNRSYASSECLWVDETTQLSGLLLDPLEQALWLMDFSQHDFGVPDDRMPPLSYWSGWLWSQVFGLSEATMRWWALFSVAIGLPALWLLGRRVGGLRCGVLLVACYALSPTAIQIGAAIRCYPQFLGLSCWVAWAGWRAFEAPGRMRASRLAVFLALLSLTHLFGAVAFVGFTVAALAVRRWDTVLPLLVGGAVTALMLLPFVLASFGLSGSDGVVSPMAARLARFGFRLLGHPASVASDPALLGLVVTGLCGAVAVLLSWRHWNPPMRGLAIVMLVGLCLPALAAPLAGGFDTLRASYSSWLFPLLLIALATGFQVRSRRAHWASTAALVALLGHQVAADTVLLRNAELYCHGPHRVVARLLEETPVGQVVHEETSFWGHGYMPIRYEMGSGLPQYLKRADGTLQLIGDAGLGEPVASLPDLAHGRARVYMRVWSMTSMDIRKHLQTGKQPIPRDPIEQSMELYTHRGLVSADIYVEFE